MRMDSFAVATPYRLAPLPRRWWPLQVAAIMLAAALALRCWQFGNAIDGLDEQFYLLVGDRLLHGALPYVDLWDRKPFGLFALFAGIRLLGGDGVVQAQVVATIFAGLTATIVTAIARQRVPALPAVFAGLLYLAMLPILWGETTQAPVFYNLPVALAALLALDTSPALDTRRDATRAIAAMLLCGLAIQVKTDAIFEGAAIGGWLMGRCWSVRSARQAIGRAPPLMLAGILPTLLVVAGYAAIGQFPAWWFANVTSILLKHPPHSGLAFGEAMVLVSPLALLAALGLARGARDSHLVLLALWAISALADAAALGGYWPHYLLPFTVPAAILAAHVFDRRWGWAWFAVSAAFPIYFTTVLTARVAHRDRAIAAQVLAAIPADVATRCMLIYEGPVIYYHLKRACLVTRYAFTDHLHDGIEADALGEDAGVALRAALARAPGTILTVDRPLWTERNHQNDATIAAALARGYRAVARLPQRASSEGREWLMVWRRADLVRKLSNPSPYPRGKA